MSKEIHKYIKLPTDRLVSGLMIINVVHEGDSAGRVVVEDDDKASIRSGASPDINAMNYGQEIGDYGSFLYYVVAAAHFANARDVGTANINHRACQGFVRAFPIALINPDTGTLLGHQLSGSNIQIRDGVTSFGQALTLQGVHNSSGSPHTQPATGSGFSTLNFGSATNTAGNTGTDILSNPVRSIMIESYHSFVASGAPDYTVVAHSPYQIHINIMINSIGTNPKYNMMANVSWFPFGETAKFNISDSEFL